MNCDYLFVLPHNTVEEKFGKSSDNTLDLLLFKHPLALTT